MPRYEAKVEIEQWVSSRKQEGKNVRFESLSIYDVNGKKTNVHFASPRPDGTFWFSVGLTYLESIDYFVWICGQAEDYYVIPRKKMKELAVGWFSPKSERSHFRIDSKNHEYITVKKTCISEFYRNKEAFSNQ